VRAVSRVNLQPDVAQARAAHMDLERGTRLYVKPEERRGIAESCEQSGLSRSEFARRHRISLSSPQRGLAEARDSPKEVTAVVFRKAAVSPPLTASPSWAWAVEIVSPDGVTIRCRDGSSVDDLRGLLRGPRC
jgi:hypothetical protein